jgi:glycosyltransferase involved in cell wall biosynthesis
LGGLAGVLFTTREQAAAMTEAGVLPPTTPIFEVMESTSRFTPGDMEAARLATGIRADPAFLWVGRLDANKDPLTVLEAFALTSAELPGAHLWMCYQDSPLLAEVQRRIASDPCLTDRVTLLGTQPHDRIQTRLRAADFLVLGSHKEGSGYAAIEALACGTPALVTDIPSFRRITGDGRAGALSRPGDASAMARAMVAWASGDRAAQRRAAREQFERHLSLHAIGAQLRAAYEAAVARRRA